jgi:hypothetical protein
LPPLPQKIQGTANDPVPVPTPEYVHGSYHWTFERYGISNFFSGQEIDVGCDLERAMLQLHYVHWELELGVGKSC